MGKHIRVFIGQFFSVMEYRSVKDDLKTLRKMNNHLNKGMEEDASNIASDFNKAFGDINKSMKSLTKEAI